MGREGGISQCILGKTFIKKREDRKIEEEERYGVLHTESKLG
jgi:hypothetical protein